VWKVTPTVPEKEGIKPCPIYKEGDEIIIEPVIYARHGGHRYDKDGIDTNDIVWEIKGKVCSHILSQLLPGSFFHVFGVDLPWLPDKSLFGFSCPDMERRVGFRGKRQLVYESVADWYQKEIEGKDWYEEEQRVHTEKVERYKKEKLGK
jgi:uncharacterized repeat protein (TIGR04076 family)